MPRPLRSALQIAQDGDNVRGSTRGRLRRLGGRGG
jgi:hypothetical protein